jgi:hypothetical protein
MAAREERRIGRSDHAGVWTSPIIHAWGRIRKGDCERLGEFFNGKVGARKFHRATIDGTLKDLGRLTTTFALA